MASRPLILIPVLLRSCSSIGISVWLWVRAVLTKNSPIIPSSEARQTDAAFAVVSTANSFIDFNTLCLKNSLILVIAA